ncbi:hypothetical protein [Burkholderia stabilis]|uniref:hypothetical protein n=1 Tax=Burkholderia stabilis TaxID=95485 RepID=UPI001F4B5685|nr:hypothetical protein [Burkholderia stabilis]
MSWSLSFDNRIQGMCVISESVRMLDSAAGRHDSCLLLESLVTLPGTQGYGSAMLELAVNRSHERGHSGRIVAEAIQNSRSFFEGMGFTSRDSMMCLAPHNSEHWLMVDGAWKLKKARPRVALGEKS